MLKYYLNLDFMFAIAVDLSGFSLVAMFCGISPRRGKNKSLSFGVMSSVNNKRS